MASGGSGPAHGADFCLQVTPDDVIENVPIPVPAKPPRVKTSSTHAPSPGGGSTDALTTALNCHGISTGRSPTGSCAAAACTLMKATAAIPNIVILMLL